jgi:BirA family biotin operon repressor/biotin-[acetyl-CoA-carboxylase] ligase
VTFWPAGYGLKEFAELDSTNEEAKRLAASGVPAPVWIRADTQTAGRGRRGRAWETARGNLAATLLLRPNRPAAECAQLSFVAAIATADAMARFAARARIEVKWPNDVLADGRKLAGILLESASSGREPFWLAIGIGINLAHFPEGVEFPAISLAALGQPAPSPTDALLELAGYFAKWYDIWARDGFAPIREAWLARAARLGMRIHARLQEKELSGVFEGIDETGALLLREGQGQTRAIAAGEVFFAR